MTPTYPKTSIKDKFSCVIGFGVATFRATWKHLFSIFQRISNPEFIVHHAFVDRRAEINLL